jgi:hypothetical protein
MKKIIFIFIFLITGFYSYSQSPVWSWASSAGGSGEDVGSGIITDAIGNSYVAGYFSSPSITLGNTTLINADPSGNTDDLLIVKFDKTGNVLWASSSGGNGEDVANCISFDNDGNIYVAGYFQSSSISIGGNTLNNTGGKDGFISKYDTSGTVVWVKKISSGGDYPASGITVDIYGNIYITGNIGWNIFVSKLDRNGNVLWVKNSIGSTTDNGISISADKNGNVFVAGCFSSPVIAFDNITLTNSDTSGYPPDIFIAKFDTDGNALWARSSGSKSYYDVAYSICTDTLGDAYITGYFGYSDISFDSILVSGNGWINIFIAKYDADGNAKWARCPSGGHGNSITADLEGNIYLTGYSGNQYIDGITVPIFGFDDIFIAKYNYTGNALWATGFGGAKNEYGNSITTDASGDIYLTGKFNSPIFNYGNETLLNAGPDFMLDLFIAKLDSADSIQNPIVSADSSSFAFPNPANKNFSLTVPSSTKEIQILNSMGYVIKQIPVDNQTNFYFYLEQTGIYYIRIISDNKTVMKKVIIIN